MPANKAPQGMTTMLTERINGELMQWQRDTLFPSELLPDNFGDLIREAFAFNSPFQLRMPIDDYRTIVTQNGNKYSVLDMGTIGHVLKLRTARELDMEMPEYVELQANIENIAKEYFSMVELEKERLTRKYEATLRAEQGVPQGKKTLRFPPTGEA